MMNYNRVVRRFNSSFIKNVMDQVKKEVDHDPKMKKAWEEFAAKKQATESKFQGFDMSNSPLGKIKDSQILDNTMKAAKEGWTRAATATQPIASKIGQSINMRGSLDKLRRNPVMSKVKSATGTISSKLSSVTDKLGLKEDTQRTSSSYQRWKIVRDATVAEEAKEAEAKRKEENPTEDSSTESISEAPTSQSDGLVVSDRGNSSWDRFGANMRDMPFLNAFYNNPLMDTLFGETEISASIRQMREEIDPAFRLDEFVDEIESIVTPRFIKWYLEGDGEKLKLHCGEAAYAAVNASIGARQKQKLSLDTNVLSGPSDFELKAAKSGSAGESAVGASSPLFVFTFNAQQINCLRDHEGNVVEGAVDDIRQLFYAIAVQRNPKANSLPQLEFPWQIQEIAILGNQPCW